VLLELFTFIVLLVLLWQTKGICCSEPQVQHLLFVSYMFAVEDVLFVAISLTIR